MELQNILERDTYIEGGDQNRCAAMAPRSDQAARNGYQAGGLPNPPDSADEEGSGLFVRLCDGVQSSGERRRSRANYLARTGGDFILVLNDFTCETFIAQIALGDAS